MAYVPKELSGSLFKNDKQKPEQPDYRGSIMIGGQEYRLSAWIKDGKAGTKFMSIAAQPKEQVAPGGEVPF